MIRATRLLLALFCSAAMPCGAAHALDAVPRPFCVCIDPGHPSERSSGTDLHNGLREVSIVWGIAQFLRRDLEAAGCRVVMTKRAERQYVTNRARADIANAAHADLFLRLHTDAGAGSGFAVYYPRKQGRAMGVRGPAPSVLRASAAAARRFQPAFAQAMRGALKDNGLRGDEQTYFGRRQGALTGSIFSAVPTVLVEMAFLTNKRDAAWVRDEAHQRLLADALARGVLAVRDARGSSQRMKKGRPARRLDAPMMLNVRSEESLVKRPAEDAQVLARLWRAHEEELPSVSATLLQLLFQHVDMTRVNGNDGVVPGPNRRRGRRGAFHDLTGHSSHLL